MLIFTNRDVDDTGVKHPDTSVQAGRILASSKPFNRICFTNVSVSYCNWIQAW